MTIEILKTSMKVEQKKKKRRRRSALRFSNKKKTKNKIPSLGSGLVLGNVKTAIGYTKDDRPLSNL